ncbi:hypothetical protein [Cytobacillus firmus]|uniref:hypothetical protein n=1 Tax=Cytobacillus firmus TaxID=1399 RepID=UPI001C8E5899|nr:hypothetical protein [Cytobacillus firmus]MBX9972547.1 hypothetical protein [Cytobacillus firmus]
MKKFISMIFTLLLVISISSPTSASTNHLDHHNHDHDIENHEHESGKIKGEKGGDFGALYIPCPVTGTKHQMKARGTGKHTLTNGSTWIGNLYQCSGCLTTVTTYYNYFNSGERPNGPGKYILASAPVFVSPAGYVFSGKYTLSGPATSWLTGVFGSMSFSY